MELTPNQEDFALKSCHPSYAAFCNEDEEIEEKEDEMTRAEFEREWMENR